MKKVVPDYYDEFKCIADKCKHSCCIGWDVYIDEKTLEFYKSLDGKAGEKIIKSITHGKFLMDENKRCPHLKKNGLCNIICELGEESLCDICSLHPRFRNFYADFIEEGLGLCCEEVTRIILNRKEKFFIKSTDDIYLTEQENFFLTKRAEILDKLQNRSQSIRTRFESLLSEYGTELRRVSAEKLYSIYMPLERLDSEWTSHLESIKNFNSAYDYLDDENFFTAFEQLACYFVFRHFTKVMDDGDIASKVRFSIYSCLLIAAICEAEKIEKVDEIARMYSAEIEYSEENMSAIFCLC